MIAGFAPEGGRLRSVDDPLADLERLVWIDLLNPSADEETTLEAQLGVDIPTREEMQRLEVSGRLYKEDDAVVMTATLPARTDSDDLLMAAVAFVITRASSSRSGITSRACSKRSRSERCSRISAARAARRCSSRCSKRPSIA